MTVSELLDLLRPEVGGVYSSRAYVHSQGVRVLLIDMSYPDDVDRVVDWLRVHTALVVKVVNQRLWVCGNRRRIVVTGFSSDHRCPKCGGTLGDYGCVTVGCEGV